MRYEEAECAEALVPAVDLALVDDPVPAEALDPTADLALAVDLVLAAAIVTPLLKTTLSLFLDKK